MGAPLCTLEQVCAKLSLNPAKLPQTVLTRLNDMITGVSAAARSYTGNKFETATYTETFDGNVKSFYLKNRPVLSAQSVTVLDLTQAQGDQQQDPSTFGVDLAAGLVFPATQQAPAFTLDGGAAGWPQGPLMLWGFGRQRWMVSYQAGIGVPDDVSDAVADWIASLKNITPGVTAERIGDYSYSTNQLLAEMPGYTRNVLNSYKGSKIRLG